MTHEFILSGQLKIRGAVYGDQANNDIRDGVGTVDDKVNVDMISFWGSLLLPSLFVVMSGGTGDPEAVTLNKIFAPFTIDEYDRFT